MYGVLYIQYISVSFTDAGFADERKVKKPNLVQRFNFEMFSNLRQVVD